MCKKQNMNIIAGLFLVMMIATHGFAQSSGNRPQDAGEVATSKAKISAVIDPEDVARAEERAESLRAKLFNLQIQEIDLQASIEDLDYQLTPEGIRRALMFTTSVRPMDELREALRIRLENQKERLNKKLELLALTRERLESAIVRADEEIDRLRQKLNSL